MEKLYGEFVRCIIIVVQVMSDISTKQDCILNKQIPWYTEIRFCIHHK